MPFEDRRDWTDPREKRFDLTMKFQAGGEIHLWLDEVDHKFKIEAAGVISMTSPEARELMRVIDYGQYQTWMREVKDAPQ